MRLSKVSLPTALLIAAAATSGVLLIVWQSHLTFFFDDWDPLLHRRGFSADVLFSPHVGHILITTTLVYKAIQTTFGMENLLPYAVVSTSTFLVSVILLFVYLRRRVGAWLALAGVLPILFLGSAHEDLLRPFQIFFFGSMASGLGALLVLERPGRRNDRIACLLLIVSFTFSELALPFVLGVAVAIALDRGPLRRAYVVALPLLFYAAWYLGWGHTGPSYLSFDNVANSLPYMLDGLAAGIASLLGLAGTGSDPTRGLEWGRPLLLGLLLAAGLRTRSATPIARSFWVTLVILLSFWFITAANATIFRAPTVSRYQYMAAILILLVAADLARGLRLRPPVIVIGIGIAGIAVAGNLSELHRSYLSSAESTPAIRGQLTALEIATDSIEPDLTLHTSSSLGSFAAGPYLSAVDAFGSPAYTQSELARAPETGRVAADQTLATVFGLAAQPVSRPPGPGPSAPRLLSPADAVEGSRPGCIRVRSTSAGSPVVSLPPGGAFIEAPKDVASRLSLRRFASASFPIPAQMVRGSAVLAIPEDRSSRPWQLQVLSAAPVTVCARTG